MNPESRPCRLLSQRLWVGGGWVGGGGERGREGREWKGVGWVCGGEGRWGGGRGERGGRDDVLGTPIGCHELRLGPSVHCQLLRHHRVHSGHETLDTSVCFVHDRGRSQAIGRALGVGHHGVRSSVFVVTHAHHVHGHCVFGRRRDDRFLRSSSPVQQGLVCAHWPCGASPPSRPWTLRPWKALRWTSSSRSFSCAARPCPSGRRCPLTSQT